MKILIMGAGKMGLFMSDALCMDHEVALYDTNPDRLRFGFKTLRFSSLDEVRAFGPEMVINAVTVKYTIDAFRAVLPYVSDQCILSDIASVKTGLPEFYAEAGHPFVSTHPMFGPTFANLSDLSTQFAIIISESDFLGRVFFRELYKSLQLTIYEYTFQQHDETIAYSLTIPFVSTLAFTGVMKPQKAPGTTFKKHMAIARGLLSEDDFLLTEILFNPHSPEQIDKICDRLHTLADIIRRHDAPALLSYINESRRNIADQA
jgi:prephenate dehydrogenase